MIKARKILRKKLKVGDVVSGEKPSSDEDEYILVGKGRLYIYLGKSIHIDMMKLKHLETGESMELIFFSNGYEYVVDEEEANLLMLGQ